MRQLFIKAALVAATALAPFSLSAQESAAPNDKIVPLGAGTVVDETDPPLKRREEAYPEHVGKPVPIVDPVPYEDEESDEAEQDEEEEGEMGAPVIQPPAPVGDNSSLVRRDPPISVGNNDSISVDGFGILDEDNGGVRDGIWSKSERKQTDSLLDAITGGIHVAPLRELVSRALLTSAAAPGGHGGSEDFLQKRLQTLFFIGKDDKIHETIIALPSNLVSEPLSRLSSDILLLKGDYDGVCRQASGWLGQYETEYFQRLMIFCQTREGKQDEARLGLDLLEEQNRKPSAFFLQLLKAFGGNASKQITIPADVTPSEVAMAVAAKQKKFSAEYLQKAPLPVLKMVARNQNGVFGLETAASAAERGVLYGVLELDVLQKAYDAYKLDAGEDGTQAKGASPLRTSASLYQQQKKLGLSRKRLDIISRAYDTYVASGLRDLWFTLYGADIEALKNVVQAGEGGEDGERFIDALIFTGKFDTAGSLIAAATKGNKGSAYIYDIVLSLASERPLGQIRLSMPDGATEFTITQNRRVFRLQNLVAALGVELNGDAPVTMGMQRVSSVVEHVSPQALSRLDNALNEGREGDALLLCAILAGGSDLSKVDDMVLDKVVRVLLSLGYEKEARALVVRSVLSIY